MPEGADPLIHLWAGTGSRLTGPAAALSEAVYAAGSLPLRVREAARVTVATVNQCQICLGLRADETADHGSEAVPDQEFYDAVLTGSTRGLAPREALAAEYARRFATDHLAMDDDLWARLREAFTETELVDLAVSVGSWLALGRMNQVFGVDAVCSVPVPGLRPAVPGTPPAP